MKLSDTLQNFIDNEASAPSADFVDEIRKKYPYFLLPSILLLERNKASLSQFEYIKRLNEVAIGIADRKSLSLRLGEDMQRFNDFYPREEQPSTPDTDTAIDTFLNRFCGNEKDKEVAALENIIFNPVPEYGITLAADEKVELPETDENRRIEQYISENPPVELTSEQLETAADLTAEVEEEPENEDVSEAPKRGKEVVVDDKSSLSESLATVYIRRGNFRKACDLLIAVRNQSEHHNPHIDDQIRFLEKAISLQKK